MVIASNARITKLYIFFLFCFNIAAQEETQHYFPDPSQGLQSPNAYSFMQLAKEPVDLFTGNIDINIPLYTLKEGQLEMPLKLIYNTSSIVPDQDPDWLGLGWTLNAGGVITRKINGKPDDFFLSPEASMLYKSYNAEVFHNSLESRDGYSMTSNNKLSECGLADVSPDIFYFNFGNYHGSFLIEPTSGICSMRDLNGLKVEVYPLLAEDDPPIDGTCDFGGDDFLCLVPGRIKSYHFAGFKVTTPDGLVYEFGCQFDDPTKTAIETSHPLYSTSYRYLQYDSWYLLRVSDSNGNVLATLDYEKEYLEHYVSLNKSISYAYSINPTNAITSPWGTSSIGINGRISNPLYLREIKTIGSTVIFNSSIRESNFQLSYDVQAYIKMHICNDEADDIISSINDTKYRKLNSISIISQDIKTYNFTYSDDNKKRFVLHDLESDDSGVYQFHYQDESKILNYPYFEGHRNIAGFATGFDNVIEDFIIETNYITPLYHSFDHDRLFSVCEEYETNQSCNSLFYGLLDTIFYPTGGKKSFDFDNHEVDFNCKRDRDSVYLIPFSGSNGCGPRIRKEQIFDTDGKIKNKTEYQYEMGIGEAMPQCLFKDIYYRLNNMYYFSTNSPESMNSRTVGYSKVTVINNEGKTENYFSNYENHPEVGGSNMGYIEKIEPEDEQYLGIENPYSSNRGNRGNLLKKKFFNNNGEVVLEEKFDYDVIIGDHAISNSILLYTAFEWNESGSPTLPPASDLHIPVYIADFEYYDFFDFSNKRLMKKTEHFIDPVKKDTLVKQLEYDYTDSRLIKKVSESNSDGSKSITKYFYPYERVNTDIDEALVSKNINIPIETQRIKEIDENKWLLEAHYNKYSFYNNQLYKEKSIAYNPITLTDASTTIDWDNLNDSFTELYIIEKYNELGNPLQVITQNGIRKSYLWAYNNLYPAAIVTNATYDQIDTAIITLKESIETNTYDSQALFNALKDINNGEAQATVYTFSPLFGKTSETLPSGQTIYYEYDRYGRLKCVKDQDGKVIKTHEYHYQTEN